MNREKAGKKPEKTVKVYLIVFSLTDGLIN